MKEYTFKVLADTSEAASKVQGLERDVKSTIKRINAETIKIKVDSSDISGLNKILDPLTSTHATKKFQQAKKDYEERFSYLKNPILSESEIKKVLNENGQILNKLYLKADSATFGGEEKELFERAKEIGTKYRQELSKYSNAEEIWKSLDTQARAGFRHVMGWAMNGAKIKQEFETDTAALEKAETELKELERLAHAETSLQIAIDGSQAISDIEKIQSMLKELPERKEIVIDLEASMTAFNEAFETIAKTVTNAQDSLRKALEDITGTDAISKAKKKIAEEARTLANDAEKRDVGNKPEGEESETTGTVERIKEIKKAHDELPTEETTITINVDGNALSGLTDINKELKSIVKNKDITISLKVGDENFKSISDIISNSFMSNGGINDQIDENLRYLSDHAADNKKERFVIFDTKSGKTSDVRSGAKDHHVSPEEREKLFKDFSDIPNKKTAAYFHSHPEGDVHYAFSPNDILAAIQRYDNDEARYAGVTTKTDSLLLDMSKFKKGKAEEFEKNYRSFIDDLQKSSMGRLYEEYGVAPEIMWSNIATTLTKQMPISESSQADMKKMIVDRLKTAKADDLNKIANLSFNDFNSVLTGLSVELLQKAMPNIDEKALMEYVPKADHALNGLATTALHAIGAKHLKKVLGEGSEYTIEGQSAIKHVKRQDLDRYGFAAFGIEEKASTAPTIEIRIDAEKAKADVAEVKAAIDSLPDKKEIIIDFKVNEDAYKSIINAVGEQIATGVTTESIGKATEAVVEKQVEEVSKKVVEDASKKSKKKQTKKNEEVIKTNIDKTLQYLSRHAEDNQGSGYFAFDAKTGEASNIRRTKSAEKIPKQSLTKLINAYPNLNNSKSGVLMRSDPYGTVAFSNWYNEAKKRWEGDITSGWEAFKKNGFRYSGKITDKDAMLLDYSKFTDEGFEQFRKDYLKDSTEAKSASIFEQLALVGVKKEEQFDYLAKELSKASGADNDALRGLMRSGLLGLSTQSDFQNLSSKDSRARIVDMARTMLQNVHKGQGITDFDYDAYTKLVNDQLDYVTEQAVNVRKRNFLQSALGKGSKYTKNNWSALKYSTVEDLDKKGISALGLKLDSTTTPTTTTTTEVDVKTDKAESKTKEIKQDIESIPDKKETQITADVSDFQKKEKILHYDKNGNPMVLTNDIPTVKLEEGKAQPSRNIVDEYEAYKKKRAQEETGFVLVDSTDKPVSALDSEAEAMKRIKEAAEQAASGKQAFVAANAKVLESAHESAVALGVEASAFEKLAQAAQGADKQKTEVENPPVTPEQKAKQDEEERLEKINQQRQQYFDMLAKSIQKDFATHPSAKEVSGRISGGSFHLSELESKLSEYSALKREFKELTSDSGDLGIQASIKNTGASLKAEIETIMKEGKHVPAYVENMQNLLNTTVTEIDPANFEKSAEAINKVNRALLAGNQNMISGSTGKMRDKIQKYINQNNAMDSQYRARLYGMLNSINDDSSVRHITEISAAFDNLKAEMGAAGQTGKSFWNTFTERIKTGSAQFLATYFGIQDVIRYAQQAVQAINEVDTALIELKKVSNASDFEIADALKVSESTAKDLGATVSDTVSATADWARLGYNLPDAEELGRVATLYKNVGDGIDINQANESLISTLQGFQMEAGDSMEIVDKFNEVANNFPIDSGGIGEALQRSAASFNAAHTDLSKSIALVTTTNAVVQDPDVVGTMWKTVSARLRGAKTE